MGRGDNRRTLKIRRLRAQRKLKRRIKKRIENHISPKTAVRGSSKNDRTGNTTDQPGAIRRSPAG